MIYSGHQISFLPWIGFWKKMYQSSYVDLSIYDQFTKSTWIHYTYIGSKDKRVKWKLPVDAEYIKHSTKYSIKDVKVKPGFAKDMLHQFYEVHHYDKYFDYIYPLLTIWLHRVENLNSLWMINLVLIEEIYNLLQLETKLVILPYFEDTDDTSLKIAKQTEAMKCDTYLSGPHGVHYLNMQPFEEKNINVEFQDTSKLYEEYPMSIISLISQVGIAKVLEILKSTEI